MRSFGIRLAALVFLGFTSIVHAQATAPEVRSIALPDAPPDGVFMDFLSFDRFHPQVWVPAGNTYDIDVVDVTNSRVAKVQGFVTSEVERNGKQRAIGPSSATVG